MRDQATLDELEAIIRRIWETGIELSGKLRGLDESAIEMERANRALCRKLDDYAEQYRGA
jgi:hypothetical protein